MVDIAVVDAVVDIVADVVVDVEDVEQDAKTNDDTIRQVNIIPIAPLFIYTSFYLKPFGKLTSYTYLHFVHIE